MKETAEALNKENDLNMKKDDSKNRMVEYKINDIMRTANKSGGRIVSYRHMSILI